MSDYTIKYVDGYMGAAGFEGCNFHKWNYNEKTLKKCLMEEFKKNGLKGISIRFRRGGYNTAFTVKVKISFNDLSEKGKKHCLEWWDVTDHKYDYPNHCGSSFLSEETAKKIYFIDEIITSYNYNRGNSMYDYYDKGFYFNIVPIVKVQEGK